jgi:Phosphatidylethanolamine-binding protein
MLHRLPPPGADARRQAPAGSGWAEAGITRPGRLARPPSVAEYCRMPVAGVLDQLSLTGSGGSTVNDPNPASPSSLAVSSPHLPTGTIPRQFTCDGADRRPRLQWITPPPGTQELAIEMLDPDALGGTFTHWLVYGLPPGLAGLAAVRPARQRASTTSAAAATAARVRRGAQRITSTSWSLHWTRGWACQPGRHGPMWSHASAVTC